MLSFDRTSRARWLCAPGILVGALVVASPLYSTALVAQETPAPTAAHRAVHPDTVLRGDALQIAAAVRAVFAAIERSDFAALDTLYAADSLTVVEGAGINRGWADYRDHHLGTELKETTSFLYRPFEIEARTVGNLGWATFRYASTSASAASKAFSSSRGMAESNSL